MLKIYSPDRLEACKPSQFAKMASILTCGNLDFLLTDEAMDIEFKIL